MTPTQPQDGSRGAALVLGSGGARGAYEVGVARFLFEELPRRLGHTPEVPIYCGTSAGALNVFGLASFAERPISGVAFLARRWSSMHLAEMLRPNAREVLRLARGPLGRPSRPPGGGAGNGLLAAEPFRRLILSDLPNQAVDRHITSGRIGAVAVTATEVATGHSTVFTQRHQPAPPLPPPHAGSVVQEGPLTIAHALASAAMPLLFAPVHIEGRDYCDGALRQNVPLAPALHLGARRVLAVSTQNATTCPDHLALRARERAVASPLYLLGKAISALTLDHLDEDLERLASVNRLLDAGTRHYGPGFGSALNRELGAQHQREVHPARALVIRPSQSLGRLASSYLESPSFRAHSCSPGVRLLLKLAEGEAEREADLASYLLFDGPFAGLLMELGFEDARARADELLALFGDESDHPTPHLTAPATPNWKGTSIMKNDDNRAFADHLADLKTSSRT